MSIVVDGGAAGIESDFAGVDRYELLFGARQRVVEAQALRCVRHSCLPGLLYLEVHTAPRRNTDSSLLAGAFVQSGER